MENEIQSSPSFLSRLGRAFIVLLRIVFTLTLVALIGGIVYYGTPYIYENLLLPIENNTARIEELEAQQQMELEQLNKQLSETQERMNELENRQTESAQNLAETQGQMEVLEAKLEDAIRTHNETLENLAEIEDSLVSLFATSKEHENLLVISGTEINDLRRQVSLSRTIEMLTRAQLYLSQNNFGLANADIKNARDVLLALQTEMSDERAKSLEVVIDHLNFSLKNLPEYPIVAVDSVNIAWQLLVNDLPDSAELPPVEETETPTPETEATSD
ncbi:MAG TPA: hypothetical protein EYP74_00850 [Anaerolineales bacterium]|nr:hypothetical protein [Anaerolineales bacterium]